MFPQAYDFTNRILEFNGDRSIWIEEQLTEVTDQKFGQRHILTLARYMDNDEEIIFKICYEYVQYICIVTRTI